MKKPKITFFCEKCNKEKRIVQFLYCYICNKITLEETKQSLCQWCGEDAVRSLTDEDLNFWLFPLKRKQENVRKENI